MTIVRDGKEIELTAGELEYAYRERRRYYKKQDIKQKIKDYCDEWDYEDTLKVKDDAIVDFDGLLLTGKQIRARYEDDAWLNMASEMFEEGLDNNDSFWECYWFTAEETICGALSEELKGK